MFSSQYSAMTAFLKFYCCADADAVSIEAEMSHEDTADDDISSRYVKWTARSDAVWGHAISPASVMQWVTQ